MQTYIYNKDLELLETLNYNLEEFKKEPLKYYPDFNEETMILAETRFNYPILDNGIIREANKYELYKIGAYELEEDEFVVDKEIKSIYDYPQPEGKYYRLVFNKQTLEWEEKGTETQIRNMYLDTIKQYSHNRLVQGLEWTLDDVTYIQKIDNGNEVTLLASNKTILAGTPNKELWAFDMDNVAELNVAQFQDLYFKVKQFMRTPNFVFRILKDLEPNLNYTQEEYNLVFQEEYDKLIAKGL